MTTKNLVAPELDPFEYVNLTPHDVVVRWEGGERVFPASGQVLRLQDTARDYVEPEEEESPFSVPLVYVSVGEATELPPEDIDARKIYIVSRVAASALEGTRDDLVFPFGEIRDDSGRIIAVRALAYMDSF